MKLVAGENAQISLVPADFKFMAEDPSNGADCLFSVNGCFFLALDELPFAFKVRLTSKSMMPSKIQVSGPGLKVAVGAKALVQQPETFVFMSDDGVQELSSFQKNWELDQDWYISFLQAFEDPGTIQRISIEFSDVRIKDEMMSSSEPDDTIDLLSQNALVFSGIGFLVLVSCICLLFCKKRCCGRKKNQKKKPNKKEFELGRMSETEGEEQKENRIQIDDEDDDGHDNDDNNNNNDGRKATNVTTTTTTTTTTTARRRHSISGTNQITQNEEGSNSLKSIFQKKPPNISAKRFESAWQETEQVELWGVTIKGDLPSESSFIDLLKEGDFCRCLASGEVGGVLKLYLYAVHATSKDSKGRNSLSMAELSLSLESKRLSCVFKDHDQAGGTTLANFIKSRLVSL